MMVRMTTFNSEVSPIVLLLSREHVERCEIGPPLQALSTMSGTPQTTREYAGRVQLVFDGYENDPRELYSIAEVRAFVQALTKEFPYWLHFCSKSDDSLLILIRCLLPPPGVGVVRVVDGVAMSTVDTAAWNQSTLQLFGFMNGLYTQHGLSAEENSAMTQQVLQYVRRFTTSV